MSPLFVFPDTNFFLHFKHPADAPWAELGGSSDVRVVVPRTIQDEIDKKKHELSGRPKARARDMAAILTTSVLNDRTHVFREANPRVILEHFERPGSFQVPASLSPDAWGDDAFVADVLAFMEARPDARVVLLSNDGGALMTAKRFGVPFHHAVGPKWDMPFEADPRDKELAELRRANAELSRTGPTIKVHFASLDKSGKVETSRTACRPLDGAETELLIGELMARHPRQERFDAPHGVNASSVVNTTIPAGSGSIELLAPTDDAVQGYLSAYDAWIGQARTLLMSLPGALETAESRVGLTLVLENVGVEPGINVTVSFGTTPGLLLRFPAKDEKVDAVPVALKERPVPSLKAAPLPPAWRKVVRAPHASTTSGKQLPALGRNADLAVLSGLAGMNMHDLARQHEQLLGFPGHSTTAQAMAAAEIFGRSNMSDAFRLTTASGIADKALLRGILDQPPSFLGRFDHLHSLDPGAYGVAMPVPPVMADLPFRLPEPPDPYTFYFNKGRWGWDLAHVSFECKEFRHRGEQEEFLFEVFFKEGAVQRGGELNVEVHGRNLRDPVRCKVAVVRKVTDRDIMSDARLALGLQSPDHGGEASHPS